MCADAHTAKKASILPEKQSVAELDKAAQVPVEDATTPKTGTSNTADDLFAMCDVLTRPPSQDIGRPFDKFSPPTSRASESNSIAKRRQRKSLVPNTPPTVNGIEGSFIPFGDAFKSFTEDPSLRPWATTPDGLTPSLTSGTTLDTSPEDTIVREATPRVLSPTPSKRSGSYFKRIGHRLSTYWQSDSANNSSEDVASKSATIKEAPPKIVVAESTDDHKEKSPANTSLGFSSIRRLGRRSKDSRKSSSEEKSEKKSEEDLQPEVPLDPPPVPPVLRPANDSPGSSSRYAHGVLLHPIVEDE